MLEKTPTKANGNWVDELRLVLWAYRTSTQKLTDHAPYSLTCGYEVMLPVEVDRPSHTRLFYFRDQNKEFRKYSLDINQVIQDQALVRITTYIQKLTKHYNQSVSHKKFEIGDLVLGKRCKTHRIL